jgi:hypothetical protein
MLLCNVRRRRAYHVPLLPTVISLPMAFGGVAAAVTDPSIGHLGLLLFSLGIAFFTATQFRLMTTQQGKLHVRTILGVKSTRADNVALGISVHYGGGSAPTYTVYAQTDTGRLSLADALSEASAIKGRDLLESALLPGAGISGDGQADNVRRVVEAEARWRGNRAQARSMLARYEGGNQRWIAISIILLLVAIAASLALAIAARGH